MKADGSGFDGRILINGEEENDLAGRALAHVAKGENNGVSYKLPPMEWFVWENLLELPHLYPISGLAKASSQFDIVVLLLK